MFIYTSAIRGFHKFHISGQRLTTVTKSEVDVFLETYKKSKRNSMGKRMTDRTLTSPETRTGIPAF